MNKKIIEHELVNKVPSKLHNEAIDLLYTSWILGFASYYIFPFSLFYYFIKHLKKYINKIFIPILSSLLAFTITNQFWFPVIVHLTFFYIIVSLWVAMLVNTSHKNIIINKNVLLVISILLILNFYWVSNEVVASANFKKASVNMQNKHYIEANKYFNKIIYNSFRPEYQYYYINNVFNSGKMWKHDPTVLIENLIIKYPSYEENYIMKWRLLMWLKKYQKANDSFNKAYDLAPVDINIPSDWAYNLHLQWKYQDSIVKYNELLWNIPEYFWNEKKAITDLQKEKNKIFHLIKPNFNINFLHLSRNYLKIWNINKALYYLSFADQKSIDTLTTYWVIYWSTSNYKMALKYYKKAKELDRKNEIIDKSIKHLEEKLDF